MEGTVTWCHFEQRVQRLHIQRLTKRMPGDPVGRPIEHEKFAYVVLRRGPRQAGGILEDTSSSDVNSTARTHASVSYDMEMEYEGWDRVTREPRRRGRHVILDVCQALRGESERRRCAACVVQREVPPGPQVCKEDALG